MKHILSLLILLAMCFALSSYSQEYDFEAIDQDSKAPQEKNSNGDLEADKFLSKAKEKQKEISEEFYWKHRYLPPSTSVSSANNYSPCPYDDSCFVVKELRKNSAVIECIAGTYEGQEKSVCGNDKGKWAAGCGLTEVFAYHYKSLSIAGDIACGS